MSVNVGFIVDGPNWVGNYAYLNAEDSYGSRKVTGLNIDTFYISKSLRFITYETDDGKIKRLVDDFGFFIINTKNMNINTNYHYILRFPQLQIDKCPAP